jgi:uncharacterized delta-60 repeat protein
MILNHSYKRHNRISCTSTPNVNWCTHQLVLLVTLLSLLLLPGMTKAAAVVDIVGFNPDVNDSVHAVFQQADGKVLIGGDFTSINGTTRNRIARLNADGSLDTSFDPGTGVDGTVSAVSQQADGKVLIGGSFFSVNGTNRKYIARLNADGSLDAGFDSGRGPSTPVLAVAQQADGKVLIGGFFTNIDFTARNRIARLNADGSLDAGFDPGTGANHVVLAVAQQADGRVLIGGAFSAVNGTDRNYIARLNADGSLDLGFDPGTGANNAVNALAQQADGKVLIGGGFGTVNGTDRRGIARLNADGSLDASFDDPGVDGRVISLAQQSDGKVLIGGSFNGVNGSTRNNIARLNADGSLDTGFDPSTGANDRVRAVSQQADGKVLIGGDFTAVNSTTRNRIARFNADGSLSSPNLTSPELSVDIAGFNPDVNNRVLALSQQADGKVLIGGDFTSVNGTARNRIAHLNADGSLGNGFVSDPGTNGTVFAVSQQADGKALIGGSFTSINGTARNYIARLNADGSLDTGFDPGAGANDTVYAVSQQADGKVLIGGSFTSINGTDRNRIARLNADGSLDTGFDPGTGANNIVYALSQQADGKVLIGGDFTGVNDTTRNNIARLNDDGSLDTGFDPGTGANNTVYALSQQANGKVLIGGGFTSINGATHNYIARLNANGSLDTDFDSSMGANNTVYALSQQADGKVLIGGDFTNVNSTARNRIARLNADGSLDTGFDPGNGANDTVRALSQQADGKVLIGGGFSSVNDTARNNIARLNADGSLDTGFDTGTGPNSTVATVAQQADGKVLIGGFFSEINGSGRNRIARLNADGSLDTGFDPGTGANSVVYAVAQQADGRVLIGGAFSAVNGTVRPGIARLNANGSHDTGFDPGTGTGGTVFAVSQQADGGVLIGGGFTSINGSARNRIARLNVDGSLDTGFDSSTGANNTVYTLAQQTDGKVLIGGDFTTVNGTDRNRIARLNADGSLDNGFVPGTGADDTVYALFLQADGKVLIGGLFSTVNGAVRNRIARLNVDGSLDNGFDSSSGANKSVRAVSQQADGKVLIGGDFTTLNGRDRSGIARLNADGSLVTDLDTGTGANQRVFAVSQQADGKVLIGGEFTSVNGTARNYIARLVTDEAALQAVSVSDDGHSVHWLRGGTIPTLNRVTFEHSASLPGDWTLLGEGQRVSGDWELTGLKLPTETIGYLRARG